VLIVPLLIGLAAYGWVTGRALQQEGERVEAEMRQRQIEQRPVQRTPAEIKQAQAERIHWQRLEEAIQFPWNALFRAIEHASSKDVVLLELKPDRANRVVVIRGEARTREAMLAYLDALSQREEFRDLVLRHEIADGHEGVAVVGFEVRVRLR
jgi:hypothetical protein